MKRNIAWLLIFVLCLFSFAGCKNQQADPTANTGANQTVGNLTVFIPAGWNLVADESNPNQVYLCKGGTDLTKSAYVKLTGNSALPAEGTCTDVQTLEARTYGSLSWSGFSGNKSSGSVIYLLSQADNSRILATLWYTQESGPITLDDQDVQAILKSVSYAAAPAPSEPEPVPAEPTSIAGDWSGNIEFMDCSGDFESYNGVVYSCIARILVDENGNVTPYIGIAQEGGTITGFSSTPMADEMAPALSGTWNGIAFSNVSMELDGSTLCIALSISEENGNALLLLIMNQLTDGSFETLATQLGCTGYPSK